MMNQRTPWMSPPRMSPAEKVIAALALVAGVGFLLACGAGPQRPVPTQFSKYPRTEVLDSIIQTHVDAGKDQRDPRVLMTTWFLNGDPRVARFFSVRPDGTCSVWQYMDRVEARGFSKRQLPPDVMETIEAAIDELPPGTDPPLENMLIVSFRQDGVWKTRLYDRMNRPPAVSTMFAATGAPIDP